MKVRRLLSVLLAALIVMSCFSIGIVTASAAEADVAASGSAYTDMQSKITAENNYGLAPTVNEGTILQAWTWSFKNIEANLETIAEQGFTTVQVSPPNEIKKGTKNAKFLQSDNANGWWMYYQPAGFQLNESTDNALGTKAEFVSMCAKAHELGVKIIVDAVINHMGTKDGDDNNTSTDPMSHVTPKAATFEPEIYNNKLFHTPWKQMQYIESNNTQYNSTYDLTRNCTSGLPDLKTEDTRVQSAIYDYLEELVQAGADGFRFDAAKHIETPDDISSLASNFWTNTLQKVQQAHPEKEIYAYGEILNTCGINRPYSMYTKLFDVTDSASYWNIKDAVSGSGGNATPYYPNANFTSSNTVLWDESHDTYIDGATTSLNTIQRGKIWALVAGRATISSVYLARPSDSTSTGDLYSITLGDARKTSWSNATTKAINQFHNYFLGQSEYCTANSGSTAYIERGTSGAVIVNLGGTTTKNVSLANHKLAAGTYKDAISGATFTVANNKITGKVGDTGVAVIYENNAVVEPTEPPTEAPTEAPVTYILGDVNDDGEADIQDATLILRYSVGLIDFEADQLLAGDVDGDGHVTPIDATLIQRFDAGLTVKYPIGQEKEVVKPTTAPTPIPTSTPQPTTGPSDTVTLYFSNNKGWDSVNVYMWSSAGGEATAWPGVAATYVGNNDYNEGIYSVTIDTSVYDGVIFNGSGGQTVDIDVASAAAQGCGLYCLDTQDGEGHYEVGYYQYSDGGDDPTPTPTPSGDTVTLYFSNNMYWDGVNVYMWNSAGGEATPWPGASATYVGNNDYNEGIYSVTIDTSVYDSVIFNGSGGQTVDVSIAEAVAQGRGLYCLSSQDSQGHYEVGYYAYAGDDDPSPTPTPIPGGDTTTLYFSNNKGWDSVNVYMWNSAGGEAAAWPGVAATYVGNNDYGEGIYSVTVDGSYDSVIFNGSGGQTADIDVASAAAQGCGLYCLDTTDDQGHYNVGYYQYSGTTPGGDTDPTTAPIHSGDTVTLYFSNNKGWDTVNVYMWNSAGGEAAAWPGVAATYVGNNDYGEGIYSVTVDGSYDSVIFNGSGGQTADIDVATAAAEGCGLYCLDTTDDQGHYNVGYYQYSGTTPGGDTDPTTAPIPSGDTVTLYFSNNKGWDTVNVYMWNSAGGEAAAWPGVAATYVGNNDYGEGIYSVTVDSSYDSVIFNGSGGQTADIDVATAAAEGCGLYCLDTTDDQGHYNVGYYQYSGTTPGGDTTPTQGGNTPTPSGETVTLYFSNNKGWSTVNFYAFSTAGGENAEWPGVAATYVGNNDYGEAIYSATVDGAYDSVIFTDGSSQTIDIDVASAAAAGAGVYCENTTDESGHYNVGYYVYSGTTPGGDTDPTQGGDTPTPSGETVTLYFSNNKGWSTVNFYAFSTAGGENAAWPGVAATYVGNNDYGEAIYSATVDGTYDSVIFTDGSSQTIDIDVASAAAAGAGVYCESTTDESGHYNVGYYEYAGVSTGGGGDTDPTQGGDTPTPSGETVTLYFSNNKGWSSVNFYAFSTAGGENAAWPGVAATYVGNNDYGEGIYSATVDAAYDSVIFTDGSAQTTDISVADAVAGGAGVYCESTTDDLGHFNVGYYEYTGTTPGGDTTPTQGGGDTPTPSGETVTLYFSNNKGWSTVNFYAFSTAGGENAAWPGVAATYVGNNDYGEGIYSATVDGVFDSVIFTDGSAQTTDISVADAVAGGAGVYCESTTDDLGHFNVGYYEYTGTTGGGDTTPTQGGDTTPTQGGDTPTPSGETVTLYFSNNKGWSTVNFYAFGSAGGENAAWPGVAATYEGTNDYGEAIYSATVDGAYDSVIFTDGSSQTIDIDVASAAAAGAGLYCENTTDESGHYNVGYYEYAGVSTGGGGDTDPTQGGDTPTPSGDTVTLYFSNNKYWSSVNVYMWNSAGGEATAWPGVAADYVGTNDYGESIYSVTIDTSVYDSVIFNGSGGQTADVDVATAAANGCGLYCESTTDSQGHYNVGYYVYA